MHRFFVTPEEFRQDQIIITGPDVKHISRVLRLDRGDLVEVLDGLGLAARVRIEQVGKESITCLKEEEYTPPGEPPLKVTLLQGLPKGEKMELIIQKATELGVNAIIPVSCRRSVVQLDEKKAGSRRERWQRVAMEAAKQCRRPVIPGVGAVDDLSRILNAVPQGALLLMPWEDEKSQSFKDMLAGDRPGEIYILIGPEGGFEPEEVSLSRKYGGVPVSLGPRILRTETAGLACLAAIMYRWGDLG